MRLILTNCDRFWFTEDEVGMKEYLGHVLGGCSMVCCNGCEKYLLNFEKEDFKCGFLFTYPPTGRD